MNWTDKIAGHFRLSLSSRDQWKLSSSKFAAVKLSTQNNENSITPPFIRKMFYVKDICPFHNTSCVKSSVVNLVSHPYKPGDKSIAQSMKVLILKGIFDPLFDWFSYLTESILLTRLRLFVTQSGVFVSGNGRHQRGRVTFFNNWCPSLGFEDLRSFSYLRWSQRITRCLVDENQATGGTNLTTPYPSGEFGVQEVGTLFPIVK